MKFLRDEKQSIRRERGWKTAIKRLENESGQTLIMVAISMTVLLGFVGFATDVGVLLHERREVQTAADAAAIGAATEALAEGNPSTLTTGVSSAGLTDASVNGFTNASNGATVTIVIAPNITVPAFNTAGYVQATITQTSSNIFMSMFGSSTTPVSATAIASDIITSNGCIYVPDPGGAAPNAVDMGGDSLITAASCGVVVDGNLDMTGNAGLNAGFTAVSGSITGNDPTGPYVSGVPPQGFPLTFLNDTNNEPQPTGPSGKPTGCSPPAGATGMTCLYDYQGGAMTGVAGTLPSNTVFYYDEPVTISAPLTGVGDTIYVASTTSVAFNVGGNGTLSLSPPEPPTGETCLQTGNPLCGIVFDAPTDGETGGTYACSSGNKTGNGKINFGFGSTVTTLTGVVYAPYAQLFLQDNGGKNKGATSMNTDLIAGNLCLQSSQASVNGLTSNSPVTRAGLVY